jgi:hypothetical protein
MFRTDCNDGLGDRHIVGIPRQIANKAPIDLELVQWPALQVIQAGIAGAKIVDRHLDADPAQIAQDFQCAVGIPHHTLSVISSSSNAAHGVAMQGGRYVADKPARVICRPTN